MKISYNSPTVLSLSLAALFIFGLSLFNDSVIAALACPGSFSGLSGLRFYRLFTYIFVHDVGNGHINYNHILGNFSIILLLGPIIEKQYGSFNLVLLIAANSLIGAMLHILFSDNSLIGASGAAFMFIALVSMGSFRKGEIPLTFILVGLIYFTGEVLGFFSNDNISRLAHLSGAFVGAFYGLKKGSPE
jgi:rhomboid protease GluP